MQGLPAADAQQEASLPQPGIPATYHHQLQQLQQAQRELWATVPSAVGLPAGAPHIAMPQQGTPHQHQALPSGAPERAMQQQGLVTRLPHEHEDQAQPGLQDHQLPQQQAVTPQHEGGPPSASMQQQQQQEGLPSMGQLQQQVLQQQQEQLQQQVAFPAQATPSISDAIPHMQQPQQLHEQLTQPMQSGSGDGSGSLQGLSPFSDMAADVLNPVPGQPIPAGPQVDPAVQRPEEPSGDAPTPDGRPWEKWEGTFATLNGAHLPHCHTCIPSVC